MEYIFICMNYLCHFTTIQFLRHLPWRVCHNTINESFHGNQCVELAICRRNVMKLFIGWQLATDCAAVINTTKFFFGVRILTRSNYQFHIFYFEFCTFFLKIFPFRSPHGSLNYVWLSIGNFEIEFRYSFSSSSSDSHCHALTIGIINHSHVHTNISADF